MKRLNVGCGGVLLPGWINIDLYLEGSDIVKMDARALKFPDSTIDQILCSHTLEHLPIRHVPTALKEFYRVMIKGAKIEIEVPDLEWCLRNFLHASEQERWGFPLETIYGNQDHEGEVHRCGFTLQRLVDLLKAAGFTILETRQPFSHSVQCIHVVAQKP